ncbi:ABC transporter permease [Clostridium taeniosporum]|uniref:Transport permease protein n=1 Tax=Clostridium taeniosporum TaxID=394958 RepID=A0A1D7XM82_9CLOT|nr:ABC transporter permease [Clostridium taeniosporum]AOR24483.1 ABC transporter permease [Clostridium taeniosporum]
MRNLLLISKEDFKNLIKNPMWIFYGTLFPILFVSILGFLGKESYGNNVTSYDYYGITLMIYSILSSGMTSANAFMEEKIRKPNMRIVYAPGSVKSIYISKIISSFVFSCLCHLFDMIVLCIMYHIHITVTFEIMILFVLIEFFSVALGVMFCCIFKTEAMANQLLGMIINLFAVFGGLLFPMDGYGKIVRGISYLSPAKWVMKTTFSMIYDNNFSMFYITALVLIFATVIVFVVSEKTFKKEDCIC